MIKPSVPHGAGGQYRKVYELTDDENNSKKISRTPTTILENTSDSKIGISAPSMDSNSHKDIILLEQVE